MLAKTHMINATLNALSSSSLCYHWAVSNTSSSSSSLPWTTFSRNSPVGTTFATLVILRCTLFTFIAIVYWAGAVVRMWDGRWTQKLVKWIPWANHPRGGWTASEEEQQMVCRLLKTWRSLCLSVDQKDWIMIMNIFIVDQNVFAYLQWRKRSL